MSASDKKKLRKEQNAAMLTERQKSEQKEQKKLAAYTWTFIIVCVLIVAIVAVSLLQTPIKRIIHNNTVAAKVEEHKITAVELNYFYVDCMQSVYNQFSSYSSSGYQALMCQMSTGWNPAAAAGDQTYNSETGETWADYFTDAALDSAKWTYAMYDAFTADGRKMTDEDQENIDNMQATWELYATLSSTTADAYIRSIYGSSASLDSYMEYYTASYIASTYAADYIDSLTYTNDQIREYETDKMEQYNSYTWYSYAVKPSNYLEGGTTTTDEDGKESTTYSDEEIAASVTAAKADADLLLKKDIADLDAFNTAISGLEKAPKDAAATEYTHYSYTYTNAYAPNEDAAEWLMNSDRNEGDMEIFTVSSTDDDGNETVTAYYVLFYVSTDTNETNVGTVRHLLVAFEEDDDGNVTDEAKATALAKAEQLLKEYQDGEQTEDAFTTLLKKNSDDVDSDKNVNNDGLYENINADSNYVTAFRDWAIADHQEGDVEIIETEYGYHIMYYVECAELNYRDTLITDAMTNADYEAWEEDLLEDVNAELITDKYILTDFVLASN